MSEKGPAYYFILVGAILELLLTLGLFSLVGFFTYTMFVPFSFDSILIISASWIHVVLVLVPALITLPFTVMWFRWRHDLIINRRKLIATGAVGMVIAGILPGLLVLIGGIKAPRAA